MAAAQKPSPELIRESGVGVVGEKQPRGRTNPKQPGLWPEGKRTTNKKRLIVRPSRADSPREREASVENSALGSLLPVMRVSELGLVVTYSRAITAPDAYHTGAGREAEDGLSVFRGENFCNAALPEIRSKRNGVHLPT